MKTAEEILSDLRRYEKYGCNLHNPKFFRSVIELIDARAELEAQLQMTGSRAQKAEMKLKELDQEHENAEEHMRLIVLEMSNGQNDLSDGEGTSYEEVLEIVKQHKAELEQQNQVLREALDKCLLRLRALGTCAMSDREWEYLNKTIIDCVSALSTPPPPTQQWVRKEVADMAVGEALWVGYEVYRYAKKYRGIYIHMHDPTDLGVAQQLDLAFASFEQSAARLQKEHALTAYEAATKQNK